ncbi:MAG: ABC transporter substrate-binding protein [Acidimicrobiales bacterium]
MRARRWQRGLAVVAVLAAAAAACGSDGGDESAGVATTAKAAAAAGGSAAAVNLANTVAGEDPSAWGVKDKKLTGPGGFTIDLSNCPGSWNDKAGITETEIRLGAAGVLSGPVANSAGYSLGMKTYFDTVNATEGGIGGKRITYDIKDSAYEAARGKAATDELIETGNLFAFTAQVGTPIMLATYDRLNEVCMPNIYGIGAHPAQADPVGHPWTTGTWVPYSVEANLWADYIVEKFGKGATVAALVINNDYGTIYKSTFTKAAKDKGLNFVKSETHDLTAANVTNEMTTLASSNADVFIAMTGSVFGTQVVEYLSKSSYKPKERMTSQVNNTISSYKPVGAGADGWVLTGGAKDVNDPANANDPFIKQWKETLTKAGHDFAANGRFGNGADFAWPTVENLKRAAQLPGGLSRTNLMLAVRSFSSTHPMYGPEIKFEMNGAKDAHPVEGATFVRYTVAPGQDAGTFAPIGKTVDVNGKTESCAYDGKECR